MRARPGGGGTSCLREHFRPIREAFGCCGGRSRFGPRHNTCAFLLSGGSRVRRESRGSPSQTGTLGGRVSARAAPFRALRLRPGHARGVLPWVDRRVPSPLHPQAPVPNTPAPSAAIFANKKE